MNALPGTYIGEY